MPDLFHEQRRLMKRAQTLRVTGRVVEVTGLTVVADGFPLPVGTLCDIQRNADEPIAAQVIA